MSRPDDPTLPRLPAASGFDWDGVDESQARERIEDVVGKLTETTGSGARWSVSELSGGANNLNFRVVIDGVDHALRISDYDGERMGGTRENGFEVQSTAAAGGIGAPVLAYCAPEGHCIASFIPGEALDNRSLRQLDKLAAAARLVARMHSLGPIETRWSPFEDIEHYLEIVRREQLELTGDFADLKFAVDRIKRTVGAVPGSEAFCHNDLQIQNFINDPAGRLWLVDWEWAGMGNRYFDLGGFVVNAELSAEEAVEFVRAYFGPDADVEVELARIELMRVVSAVREAVWAVVMEPMLENDWDYRAWAEDFFERGRRIADSPSFEELLTTALRPG
jgi:thiamine kinase-like enzyme